MEIKRFLSITITLMALTACGGQGTEVLSPPNPSETPVKQKLETALYEILMTLPDGWTYTEYGPGVTPGPEAFTDIDPATVTVAQFDKDESGFTIFFSSLASEQTLETFVRARNPVGDIKIETVSAEENIYLTIFYDEAPGPNGGFVVEVYAAVDQRVLWMRAEAVGTNEEQDNILNDFFEVIIPSIEFQPKQ